MVQVKTHTLSRDQQNAGITATITSQILNNYPRRGRSNIYHPDRLQCGPCALWEQSGADPNLRAQHPQDTRMRHASSDAHEIARYAQCDSTSFNISFDSCICKPCYHKTSRETMAIVKTVYHGGLRKSKSTTSMSVMKHVTAYYVVRSMNNVSAP